MFQTNGVSCKSVGHETLSEASEPVKTLIDKISGNVDVNRFMAWWSMVHGYTVIAIGNYKMSEKDTINVLREITKIYIKGIK